MALLLWLVQGAAEIVATCSSLDARGSMFHSSFMVLRWARAGFKPVNLATLCMLTLLSTPLSRSSTSAYRGDHGLLSPDLAQPKTRLAEATVPQAVAMFARPNKGNTALFALPDEHHQVSRTFDRAVCSDGKMSQVKFVGPQNESSDADDRFEVIGGTIGGRLCVLFDHAYLETKEILPVTDRQEECRSEVRSRIPSIDGRETRSCLSIATFAGTARLLAVEYAPQGNHLLAAFVVLAASGVYVEALPAEQGESAWRVDDGGHF